MTDAALLVLLLGAPLLTAVVCLGIPSQRTAEGANLAGGVALLLLGGATAIRIGDQGEITAFWRLLRPDALSAVLIGVIGVLGFSATVVSVRYLRHEADHGEVPRGEWGVRLYYAGLHVFLWTMLVTVSVDNLGLLWVGVEATTLASALLVGFARNRAALEAAWKYLLLCTVGIVCALYGVMLTYFAARIGADATTLNWSELTAVAPTFDPDLMRLAFVFILVGFGTKAGFAPLHTWLADAHSQAPSPVSGLLSGVLLSCALYGIIRFHSLTTQATGSAFSGDLLILFGVVSLIVAAPFILLARDVKRMLAYSSVEHIGLIALAIGIGGPAGIVAAMLHLINHAAGKGLLFFVTGEIVQRAGSRRIAALRGLLRTSPVLAVLFLLGAVTIAGAPPFSIFTSEMLILLAGFRGRTIEVVAACIALAVLAAIFVALLRQAISITHGDGRGREADEQTPYRVGYTAIAYLPLVAAIVVLGVWVPEPLREVLESVARIVEPTASEVARR